jgi:YggT family protein
LSLTQKLGKRGRYAKVSQINGAFVYMFVLGNFLKAVAIVLNYVLTFYMWIVIARAVLSWVNPDPYNPIVRFIHNVTEPVLHRIRTKIPVNFGGIDFSPILVILAVVFLQNFVVNSLIRLSASFM